jgi:hypothetical protein
MSPDDGQERLLSAVEALAVSSEPIHRRLELAGMCLLPLRASDFKDPENAARFEEILRSLTAVGDPTGDHGDLTVSTFATRDEAAVRVASMIFDLHRRVYPW